MPYPTVFGAVEETAELLGILYCGPDVAVAVVVTVGFMGIVCVGCC